MTEEELVDDEVVEVDEEFDFADDLDLGDELDEKEVDLKLSVGGFEE
ncbi:MAG: hypothetical protein AAB497_03755 [Patescibacteria group bacterium]